MGQRAAPALALEEAELVDRIRRRDHAAFETLMRRYNPRLFRVARSILKDDADAEDALQEAYLSVYRHLDEFRGESRLATWLVRVVANHALMRLRKQKRDHVVLPFDPPDGDSRAGSREIADPNGESPNAAALRAEVRRILERRIDELPVTFRTVFVLREIEGMSVEESAECLGIPPSTVRTRLFRARALLREALARDIDVASGDVFAFAGQRCDRIVAGVLARVRER